MNSACTWGRCPCCWSSGRAARQRELGQLGPLARIGFAFGLLMLVLSLGKYGLLYQLVAWLPVVAGFRCPCRYIFLFQLVMAGLAAIGFLLLIREHHQARQQRSQGKFPLERSWLAVRRNFEPLWCVVGFSAAVAVAGFKLRHESFLSSPAAIAAGPLLLALAATLLAMAAQGMPPWR